MSSSRPLVCPCATSCGCPFPAPEVAVALAPADSGTLPADELDSLSGGVAVGSDPVGVDSGDRTDGDLRSSAIKPWEKGILGGHSLMWWVPILRNVLVSVGSEVKRAYVETLEFFLKWGRAPHYTELSKILVVGVDRSLELQRAAAEAGIGSWFLEGTDFVECWAPFSNIPTNHLITIDGQQRWYGQCGLESLAVTWLVPGREVRIESFCLDCGETVTVVQKDGDIVHVDPPEAVGHVNESFARFDWDERKNFI